MWGSNNSIRSIYPLQKKVIRAICFAKFDEPCGPLFKKLNILPVPLKVLYFKFASACTSKHRCTYLNYCNKILKDKFSTIDYNYQNVKLINLGNNFFTMANFSGINYHTLFVKHSDMSRLSAKIKPFILVN